MKRCVLGVLLVLLVVGFNSPVLGDTDATGDNIGPLDLQEVNAELYERDDGSTLLKISVNSTPNFPGVVIFTADVDNSTGTGGSIGQLGAPVGPCPCKTTAGTIFHIDGNKARTEQMVWYVRPGIRNSFM